MTLASPEGDFLLEIEVTDREYQVLIELVRDGPDNATICRRLDMALDTVKTHIKHLLFKTGYTSRTELVVGVLQGDVYVYRSGHAPQR